VLKSLGIDEAIAGLREHTRSHRRVKRPRSRREDLDNSDSSSSTSRSKCSSAGSIESTSPSSDKRRIIIRAQSPHKDNPRAISSSSPIQSHKTHSDNGPDPQEQDHSSSDPLEQRLDAELTLRKRSLDELNRLEILMDFDPKELLHRLQVGQGTCYNQISPDSSLTSHVGTIASRLRKRPALNNSPSPYQVDCTNFSMIFDSNLLVSGSVFIRIFERRFCEVESCEFF
jgi:hypothetical protein